MMITALSREDAERVADIARGVALFLHGLAGIAAGELATWDVANNRPYTVGLGLKDDLDLSDLERAGLAERKVSVHLDLKLVAVMRQPGHAFTTQAVGMMLGSALGTTYELVMRCDTKRKPPHSHPTLEFLRHIRNASFHGNRFNITSDCTTAEWRGRRIDAAQEHGKELLFRFLGPGDVVLLLSDALTVVQPGIADPVALF